MAQTQPTRTIWQRIRTWVFRIAIILILILPWLVKGCEVPISLEGVELKRAFSESVIRWLSYWREFVSESPEQAEKETRKWLERLTAKTVNTKLSPTTAAIVQLSWQMDKTKTIWIEGFKIYRCQMAKKDDCRSEVDYVAVATLPRSSRSFTDILEPRLVSCYLVSALNRQGEEGEKKFLGCYFQEN